MTKYIVKISDHSAHDELDKVCDKCDHPDRIPKVAVVDFSGPREALEKIYGVDAVFEDEVMTKHVIDEQVLDYHLPRLARRTTAYEYQRTGSGVYAYVIDDGIRTGHQEFGGRASVIYSFDGFAANTGETHGTNVASCIGGVAVGTAKGVNIRGCRTDFTTSNIVTCINNVLGHYDVNSFPAVVCMSFGSPTNSLETSVQAMLDAGITCVASAGNDGTDALNYPAAMEGVISVASSNEDDNPSSFTNYGETIDIFSPGSNIVMADVTGDTIYSTASGTSFSAPSVAGIIAMILHNGPKLISVVDTQNVWAVLKDTSEIGFLGLDGVYSGTSDLVPYSNIAPATVEPYIISASITAELEDTSALFLGSDIMYAFLDDTAATFSAIHDASGRLWEDVVTAELVMAWAWSVRNVLDSTIELIPQTFYNPQVELQLTVGSVLEDLAAYVEEASLAGTFSTTENVGGRTTTALQGGGTGSIEILYNPTPELTLAAVGTLQQLAASIETPSLQASAGLTAEVREAAAYWLKARSEALTQTELQKLLDATLEAIAGDSAKEAFAALATEMGQSSTSLTGAYVLKLVDDMAASLVEENVMLMSVSEELLGAAGDTVQALGHYITDVKDFLGAWLVLKTSGEVIQGWVMNVEGERPLSEYGNYDFNSMARIKQAYMGAADTGLYMLSGDEDAGAKIDAHVTTMMLDFGTTAQKRVVAAYLGYTSTGTVVLKVRSVDDGQLVEHWYEAQEVRADAPREGYKPLGRGLKSRYWQFTLANVDGADFELDKLELQPLKLRRRV